MIPDTRLIADMNMCTSKQAIQRLPRSDNKNNGYYLATVILQYLVLIILTACTPAKQDNTVKNFFKDASTKASVNQPIPSAVTDALIPDLYQTVKPALLSHRGLMNISVHELNARDFFMGLVVDSDANMVVHPEVSGTISLELKNVTVPQVLDTVEKVYGYDYKKTDIGYIVFPATMQTRTYKVDKLAMRRMGNSNVSVMSGQSTNNNQNNNQNNSFGNSAYGGFGNNSYPGNNNASNNPGISNINAPISSTNSPYNNNQNNVNFSGSSVNTITQSDFWQELETSLKSIISIDNTATVAINRQTGLIIIRAKPMQLREVENYLHATQNQIAKQIILEAKILEVILDTAHQDGVNWDIVARNATLVTTYGIPISTNIDTVNKFVGSLSSGNFKAVIELLESQGKTRILSSPRISALNNQTAIIKVGQDEYFITNVSQTTSNYAVNSNNTQNVNFSQFFSGIALDITPQIDDNNEISLHIHPSITRVSSQALDYTINGQPNSVPLALNVVREADSIVKAKDGQIIVLGGLMQEKEIETKEGIFGLTRIPYLGNLFRMNNGITQKVELVILIKPTLITEDADWQQDINNSKKRIEQLDATPQWK